MVNLCDISAIEGKYAYATFARYKFIFTEKSAISLFNFQFILKFSM